MGNIGDHTVLRALFAPAGAGSRHLLSVEQESTSVLIDGSGALRITRPEVAAGLVWLQENSTLFAVVLRSYTGERAMLSPGADDLEVQEIRGWVVRDGVWLAMPENVMFNAACTDPGTGEPLPPEPALEYRGAWAVIPRPRQDTGYEDMGYGAYW